MTMTAEPTVLDKLHDCDASAEAVLARLRAASKPRRQWRETKSSLQDSVSRLEREVERVADRFRQAQERAAYNGRAALIGWATVAALAVLLAWKWH